MQIGNFVQMTFDQLDEFDAFKQNEFEGKYSYLKRGKLLNTFLNRFDAVSAYMRKMDHYGHSDFFFNQSYTVALQLLVSTCSKPSRS